MSRHLVQRALVLCLGTVSVFAGTAVLRPGIVQAQGKKSVAVGTIEGPGGDATRKKILGTLKKSSAYEITDAEDLRPGSDKGAYSAMAQALQVQAIIVGKTTKGGDVTLNVIGPDGNVIQDVKIKNKEIESGLETALAAPLGGKKAAEKVELEEEEEEAPAGGEKPSGDEEEDEEKPAEEGPPPEASKVGLRPIEVLVGLRMYNRSLTYKDYQYGATLNGPLQPYKLAIAPAIIASARVYPLAFTRDDWLSNVGITGKLELGIATSTNYQQPSVNGSPPVTYKLNNGTSEWQLGLRGRLPLGNNELGIFGSYGSHAFILTGDEGGPGKPDRLVPDVNYQFVRFGFDARLHVSKLTVGAHFAPRFLTTLHQMDEQYLWFPGATGSGIDFGAMVGYQIFPFLDVAVGGDYLRYAFDFNNLPDTAGIPDTTGRVPAPFIAGGATDTYISGWVGVILHFDASASTEDGSVSVEAEPSKGSPDVEEEEEP